MHVPRLRRLEFRLALFRQLLRQFHAASQPARARISSTVAGQPTPQEQANKQNRCRWPLFWLATMMTSHALTSRTQASKKQVSSLGPSLGIITLCRRWLLLEPRKVLPAERGEQRKLGWCMRRNAFPRATNLEFYCFHKTDEINCLPAAGSAN